MPIISVKDYGDNLFNSQVKIPYSELPGFISSTSLNYHYNVLHKKYCDNYNKDSYNLAGNYLHNMFFSQFTEKSTHVNQAFMSFILIYYSSFNEFRLKFEETCSDFRGSGWVYLDNSGSIKTIEKHVLVDDIVLILDIWEHSFYTDFGPDKTKYIGEFWNYISWDIVNRRISDENKSTLGRM